MKIPNMKIPFDDIEFPASSQCYCHFASYKDKPFTGIAYDEDERFYAEWSYKDGNANGRWYEINKTTQILLFEEIYVDGKRHGDFKKWDENGQLLRFSSYENDELELQRFWNPKGILVKHFDRSQNVDEEYYENGTLYKRVVRFDNSNNQIQDLFFLGSEQEWLATCLHPEDTNKWSSCKFNTPLILKRLPDIDPQFHHKVVWSFSKYIIGFDQQLALKFFGILSQHTAVYFRNTAAYFLGELGSPEGITYLQPLLSEHEKHSLIIDRFGDGAFGFGLTVAENAEKAIEKISLTV